MYTWDDESNSTARKKLVNTPLSSSGSNSEDYIKGDFTIPAAPPKLKAPVIFTQTGPVVVIDQEIHASPSLMI